MLTFEHVRDTLDTIDEDVITLILHVDPGYQQNQARMPAWRIFAKDALKQLAAETQPEQQEHFDAARSQVEDWLENYSPTSKTLVLMIGHSARHIHELPIVLKNQAAFGAPLVAPLLWAIDEYERYLIVLVDQEQARFASAYLGYADTNTEMAIDFDDYDFGNKGYINARGTRAGQVNATSDSSKDQFEDMHSEHIKRFHKDVAAQIRQEMDHLQTRRIILGGNEKAAHQLRDLLHEDVRKHVVDILPIPVDTDDTELAQAIREVAAAYERDHEQQLLAEVIGFAKANGRGALGSAAIFDLLEQQQVDLLILPWPVEDPEMASSMSVQALRNGASVELIHGRAADQLRAEADAAARLYYAIQSQA